MAMSAFTVQTRTRYCRRRPTRAPQRQPEPRSVSLRYQRRLDRPQYICPRTGVFYSVATYRDPYRGPPRTNVMWPIFVSSFMSENNPVVSASLISGVAPYLPGRGAPWVGELNFWGRGQGGPMAFGAVPGLQAPPRREGRVPRGAALEKNTGISLKRWRDSFRRVAACVCGLPHNSLGGGDRPGHNPVLSTRAEGSNIG